MLFVLCRELKIFIKFGEILQNIFMNYLIGSSHYSQNPKNTIACWIFLKRDVYTHPITFTKTTKSKSFDFYRHRSGYGIALENSKNCFNVLILSSLCGFVITFCLPIENTVRPNTRVPIQ